jgi:hypothetical protein
MVDTLRSSNHGLLMMECAAWVTVNRLSVSKPVDSLPSSSLAENLHGDIRQNCVVTVFYDLDNALIHYSLYFGGSSNGANSYAC